MVRTDLGFLVLPALAALAACSSSGGGGDPGNVPGDVGAIEINYDDLQVSDDGAPLADTGEEGTLTDDASPPGDHGKDTTPPKDDGDRDDHVPPDHGIQDPGGTDEGPTDPGPPCEYPVSDWGLRDNCDGTMLQQSTGLTWTKGQGYSAELTSARSYCVTLVEGGFSDWRLPSIDELRGLVVGCDAKTGPDGSCPVHDNVIDTTLRTADCDGCASNQGPAVKPGGTARCYMDNTFDWYCNLFWSNTQVKATSTSDKRSWYIQFYDARIDAPPTMSAMGSAAVKCVRGP